MPTVRMQGTSTTLGGALEKLALSAEQRGRIIKGYTDYSVSIYEADTVLGSATSKVGYNDALALARQSAGIVEGADMTKYQLRVEVQARAAGACPAETATARYTNLF